MSTSDDRGYHHGDLRAALLDAACALLEREGVEALTLRAVARATGVSPMAPYRHYPNKEALLAAVATQGFAGLRDALRAADGAAAPGQALVEQAVAYVGFALARPAMFRVMFGLHQHGHHPALEQAGGSAFGVLAERVAALIPDSAMRGSRALGCWALVHGLASLILDGRMKGAAEDAGAGLTRTVAAAMLGGWARAK